MGDTRMWCAHCGLPMARRRIGGWMHAATNYTACSRMDGYWSTALPLPGDRWGHIPPTMAQTLHGPAAFYPGPRWNFKEKPAWPTMV